MFRKTILLSVLAAAFVFGGVETRFSDTTDAAPENPLNPRVGYAYPSEKSAGSAIAWSALGTLAPMALGLSLASMSDNAVFPWILMTGGLAVGPSLGEFYAGSPYRGFMGIGLRMAGEFTFLYVGAKSAPGSAFGHPLALVGLAAWAGSTAYSFYNATALVKRYNSALGTRAAWGWSPFLIPGSGGSMGSGALAWARF